MTINEPFGYKTELNWNHKFHPEYFDLTNSIYLDSIVKICIDSNITEINFWTPPSSFSLEIANNYKPNLDSVATFYSVKYGRQINNVDLRDTSIFNDSILFYNHTHLNTYGVTELTKLIKVNSQYLLH